LIKKNVVAGLGEIGLPIYKLISKHHLTVGYDVNSRLVNSKKLQNYSSASTSFLHACIPFNEIFFKNILSLIKQFQPRCIVIHSTVSPHTTKKLQQKLDIPVIYSATRGVHNRMLSDLKKYTKFYAIENDAPAKKWATNAYSKLLRTCGVKSKKMSQPLTLEFAKIVCDTSYYGWLITFSQLSNIIALKNKIDYDEMWSFSDEIHKFLDNRPKMFPGFIGGHCVIPNLDLLHHKTLNLIKELNDDYLNYVPNAKKIVKKYTKSKKKINN